MGCGINKSFVLGTECEIYLSYYILFLQFLYYRRRNKQLRETVVSMLSSGALERSNTPYMESIVETCVSKNQRGIFAMWVWLERKSWRSAEAICVYVCEREKNDSFEIHVIILRHIRHVNLPFKKDFKFVELLTKTSFFLYFKWRRKQTKETSKVYAQN